MGLPQSSLQPEGAGPQKLIRVHRCNLTNAKSATDYRCGCSEKITQDEANSLLQSGKAERLTTKRSGKPYTRRDSIVILQTPEQIAAELERRETKRKKAARQKTLSKILTDFRKKLTPAESERWTDGEIIQAFEAKDPTSLIDGIGAKATLLKATNKEVADEGAFIKEMAVTSRIYDVFLQADIAYWDKVRLVFDENLPVNKGQYMVDAPKGCGELVALDSETLEQVDGQQETDDGRCNAANFVPRPFNDGLILDAGNGPDDTDEAARRLREQWRTER